VPEPIVVSISHKLGRDAAKQRLDDALSRIRGQLAPFANSVEYGWSGYRLDFSLAVMHQAVTGRIDVEEHALRIEIGLPLLLQLFSRKLVGRIRREGALLLEPPPGR